MVICGTYDHKPDKMHPLNLMRSQAESVILINLKLYNMPKGSTYDCLDSGYSKCFSCLF